MFLMKWTLFCLAIIVVIVISHSGEPHFLKWICPPCNQPSTTFRPPSRNWVMVSADAKKRKRLSLKRNNSLSTFSPTMEGNWFNFSIESDSPLILGEDCLVDRTAIFTTASQPLAFCRTFNLIWFPITWLSTRWVHLTFARQPTRAGGRASETFFWHTVHLVWFNPSFGIIAWNVCSHWGEIGSHWGRSGCIGEYGLAWSDMADYPAICLIIHTQNINTQMYNYTRQIHNYTNMALEVGYGNILAHPYINIWKIPKSYFSQFQNVVFLSFKKFSGLSVLHL